MKFKKLFVVAASMLALASCENPFAPEEGGADATLYHLTLTSNISLTNEQKAGLKATYAYGVRSTTIEEGIRPQDDIDELKAAGATDADIEKAGKRQSDGTYYFFEADPMFIEAPVVTGYKMTGFYDNNEFVYKPGLTDIDHEMLQGIWNMSQKDTTLEARYEKNTYEYYFNNMDDGDTNPNERGTYCYLDEGDKTLLPPTTTNKHKTFIGWEYEDTLHLDDQGHATWVLLEENKLPKDYGEDALRLNARWEYNSYKVSFNFVKYQEDGITLTYDDVITSMSVNGNLTTVDGVKEKCEGYPGTTVNKNSEIKIRYGSWLNIFVTVKSEFRIFYLEVNGKREDTINCTYMDPGYINIHSDKIDGDYLINKDSTITFVLADPIA